MRMLSGENKIRSKGFTKHPNGPSYLARENSMIDFSHISNLLWRDIERLGLPERKATIEVTFLADNADEAEGLKAAIDGVGKYVTQSNQVEDEGGSYWNITASITLEIVSKDNLTQIVTKASTLGR